MERMAVHSSNIKSIGYDPALQALEVEFIGTGVYQYANVPRAVADAFLKASSKGKFFSTQIKDKFPAKKVG